MSGGTQGTCIAVRFLRVWAPLGSIELRSLLQSESSLQKKPPDFFHVFIKYDQITVTTHITQQERSKSRAPCSKKNIARRGPPRGPYGLSHRKNLSPTRVRGSLTLAQPILP